MSRIAFVVTLALVPAIAQAQESTLPFITVDGQVGGAHHPGRSGATFYRSTNAQVARIAVAVRLGSRGAVRPVAVLDYFGTWGMGDQTADCPLAPNGTCMEFFPSFSGISAGVGVRGALGSAFTLGLIGGVGRYSMGPWHGGGERLTGFHADAEIAFGLARHFRIVGNVRHVETEKFRGARMWYRPITVGLRIQ